MNLILAGPPGTGKTTLGRLCAKLLGYTLVDTDEEISKQTGKSIAEIFSTQGEDVFRDIESNTLAKITKYKNSVISLGGGAFINEVIRKEAQKKCICIWLNWSSKTLIDRIKKNKKRPLALNLNDNELKDLIINRSKIYSKAEYKIDCENISKAEIVNKITEITNI